MLNRNVHINVRALIAIGGILATTTLVAHGPEEYVERDPADIWTYWSFPRLVTFNLLLAIAIYTIGVRRLWAKAGTGAVIMKRQVAAFGAGMLVLILALTSPIDVLSDDLGWMHMIQHMLIINIAAPLLVLGAPGLAFLWLLPLPWRRKFGNYWNRDRGGRTITYLLWQPLLLWGLFAFTLWIWHLPSLYESALRNELFHDFQHFTFLITACLFWRVLLDPVSRLRLSRVGAVLYLFFTSLHATVLGVFMALAQGVWYTTYEGRTLSWNFSALEDQQLAGLIMWMPACMTYAIVAAVVLAFWLERTSIGNTGILANDRS